MLLYDTHSFPNECEEFCEHSGHKIPQVVLLDEAGGPHRSLLDLVVKRAGLRHAPLLRTGHPNDITEMARAVGAEAMLWEFNESDEALTETELAKVIDVLVAYAGAKFEEVKSKS